jgi:hypothetical protein
MSSQLKTLSWRHNGTKYHCEVGSPLHRYFESGNEPVLEIIDCGDHYAIRTESRGGSYGPLVRAGKDKHSLVTYFDPIPSAHAQDASTSASSKRK